MASIFSQMLEGSIPAHRVWQDELCFVIVDIRPLKRGHCLVIPVQEVDQWTDLEPDVATHLMSVAHRVGRAQKQVFGGSRIGLMIAGFEVPHAHIHVTPMDSMADMNFVNADTAATDADLTEVAALLTEALGVSEG